MYIEIRRITNEPHLPSAIFSALSSELTRTFYYNIAVIVAVFCNGLIFPAVRSNFYILSILYHQLNNSLSHIFKGIVIYFLICPMKMHIMFNWKIENELLFHSIFLTSSGHRIMPHVSQPIEEVLSPEQVKARQNA